MAGGKVTFADVVVTFRERQLETKQATLSNGAVVTKLGGHSFPVRSYFSYRADELEFLFLASRWSERIEPSDTWEVAFELHGLPVARKPASSGSILELQADIRTALLAWPPGKAEVHVPVKHVRFLGL